MENNKEINSSQQKTTLTHPPFQPNSAHPFFPPPFYQPMMGSSLPPHFPPHFPLSFPPNFPTKREKEVEEIWKEYKDEQTGNNYYFNVITKETTWIKPINFIVTKNLNEKLTSPSQISPSSPNSQNLTSQSENSAPKPLSRFLFIFLLNIILFLFNLNKIIVVKRN